MKIVLTTAFNPGDLDPGKSYPHVYIPRTSDAPQGTNLSFDWEYGTATSSSVANVPGVGALGTAGSVTVVNWVKGTGSFTKTVTISGTAYLAITNQTPIISTDTSYNTLQRALYQYLLTNSIVAGSIANP